MRLVTTLLPDTREALARQASLAATPWVEVRLDALRSVGPGDLPALRAAVPQRAIATCRPRSEGGRFEGGEATREALLLAAVAARFDALDVEAGAGFLRRIADAARRAGAELIVSRHDSLPARKAPALDRFMAAVPPGAIAKYAAPVEGPEDLEALLRAAATLRAAGLRFAVMGLGDASLRLLAPALGSALVYCAPPEGPPGAPGQVPAALAAAAHAALPAAPRLAAGHRLVALLGDPVAHSLSPAMQNAAFQAQGDALAYLAVRVSKGQAKAAVAGLRALGAAGANVTTPLKAEVLPHLDKLHRDAEAAGAANTIVATRRGQLVGHATDGAGAVAALREAGAEPHGALAVVLGAGATGRAVAHALAGEGAHVVVANRTRERARALARAVGGEAVAWERAALGRAVARATLVVHCTTLGRTGNASPLPAPLLHDKLTVLDAVYRPGGTALVQAARARGAVALPGEALLLHQGALAYALWTGRPAPVGVMRAALLAAQEVP